jgi:alkaline phosphatase D
MAAGDVTDTRAVLWARADGYSALHVEVQGGGRSFRQAAWVSATRDFAGKFVFDGLAPGTRYTYRAFLTMDVLEHETPSDAASGVFTTEPPRERAEPVTFGWSGDLGGLNACRDAKLGYPIFRTLDASRLDFFVGLGDLVYADQACEARGLYQNDQIPEKVREATTVREYWEHWEYNQADPGYAGLLRGATYYAVWDDHEVVNDFGPGQAWHRYPPYTIGADLIPLGRKALLDENPIYEDPAAPTRLHRSFRWGKNVELVLLDTRSYRDDNAAPDGQEHPKTMLGVAQRDWLEHLVTTSDATWKIVVSGSPISVPSGQGGKWGRDSWASYDGPTGFEQELTGIFRTFHDAHVKNVVFITTDIHFATGFRYRPFDDDFVVYEFTCGPLNAMLLPTHAVDDTFRPERLYFFGPDSQPKNFDEAARYMNWGKIAVERNGALALSIIDGLGHEAAHVALSPSP